MKLVYIFADRHPENLRQLVRSQIPDSEFEVIPMSYSEPIEEQIKKFADAEAAFFAPGRFLDDRVIEAGKRMKLMQLWSSGYDKFNIAASQEFGVPVANNGGANKIAVAEHTMLLILSIYKRIIDSHQRTVTGNWAGNSHGMDMFTLYNKTVGLIGLGNIGLEVARRCRAFGTKVLYFDKQRRGIGEEYIEGVEFASIDRILEEADIISPHLHYSTETENIINADSIAKMKQGAVIINVSRGELVDTDAVLDALESGQLGGAGFDVYRQEPTKAGDPLLEHPKVICTPHMACTYDTHVMALKASMANLLRAKRGEALQWIVNGVYR